MTEEKPGREAENSWSEDDIAEFIRRPSSLPADLTIELFYFADAEDAQRCGEAIRTQLEIFGRMMDLSQLEQVLISFNYPETLASLDRGYGSTQTLSPTDDDVATGIAMAPTVKRGDEWKSVIVLNAQYARSLSYEPDNPSEETERQLNALRAFTVHVIAHECGHVHNHAKETEAFGKETFLQKWTPLQRYLHEPAKACWSEFIAEYMSALYGNEETLKGYEDAFCDRLRNAWPAISKAIRLYRLHGNVDPVLGEVSVHVRHVAVYCGYLFGYLARMNLALADAAPRAAGEITMHPQFGKSIEAVNECLMDLLESYPAFPDLTVFTPLSEVVHNLYKRAGITFNENPDASLYVDIPQRADTSPTLAEAFAYRTGD